MKASPSGPMSFPTAEAAAKAEREAKAYAFGQGCSKLIATLAVRVFLGGFALMLFLGMLHADVAAVVPALGYWTCVPLVWLTFIVTACAFRPLTKTGAEK